MTESPRRPRVVGPGRPVTPAERDADEWAEQLLAERLPAIRSLAERWGTIVGTLTGLLGAGSVINADDAVRALREPWSVIYGVLAGAALASAAVATYLAGRAASGGLHQVPPGVRDRMALRTRLFASAARDLALSRRTTALALLALAASFAIRWYAPVSP